MIKTMFGVFLLFLTACTTTADVRQHCAAVAASFPAEVACIQTMVSNEPYLGNNTFVQEYVLAGRVLADKVMSGEMTENEARLAFAREYNQMVLAQQQYRTYNALEFEALRPRHLDCRRVNSHVFCDTF